MITAISLQNLYNDLYTSLRKYIWDFDIVETIANLEIETYKSFPDMQLLIKYLINLKRRIADTSILNEDEELKDHIDAFKSALDENADIYANLETFKKVVIV